MRYAVITFVGGMATCKAFETATEAIDYANYGEKSTGVRHYVAAID